MIQQFKHSENGGTGCWTFLRRIQIHNSPEGCFPSPPSPEVGHQETRIARITLEGQQARKSPAIGHSVVKRQTQAPRSGPRMFFTFYSKVFEVSGEGSEKGKKRL